MSVPGKFYGVGVGPGDPELLTYKAVRILKSVDSIFLPATAGRGEGFAGSIIETLQIEPACFRRVMLSMSRQRDGDLAAYAQAADEIWMELKSGKSVAWITEGDPLIYSTFLAIWSALQERVPCLDLEIVPGISSVQAAAAMVQMPIARLDEKVAILPAAYGIGHLRSLLAEFAVIFLLKVHAVVDQLLDELATLYPPPQAFYAERVGTAEERIVADLTTLRGQKLPYFSLVMLRRFERKMP